MKSFLGIAAFLVLFLFWACHLGPEDDAVNLNLVGEEAWRSCHTLDVVLLDDAGEVLDTLFSDSLASLDQLERLSAEKYAGGKTRVRIRGFYEDGAICADQLRTFEDGGSVVVDTLSDPAAAPRAVTALPGNVSLVLNGDEVPVEGRVAPAYADQGLYWSMDSSGVAALDVGPGTAVTRVRLRPLALGEGFLTLRSRKDPSRTARVRVHVSAVAVASVTLDNDSLLLYVGGPGEGLRAVVTPFRADPEVTWYSSDPRVARVDAEGQVTAVAAGRTWVRGVSGNGKSDSALIVVKDDAPRLVVTAAPGAPVNVPLVFRGYAVQRVGHLIQYAWDFQGDGVFDDSLPGPWFGDSVQLPEVQGAYRAEGGVTARFRVKDSEGNISYAEIPVEVGNQPPLILGMPADTVISIYDSIPLRATARDRDEGVAWVGWDYEGDGAYDDTLDVAGAEAALLRGRRFTVPGNYQPTFRAVDGAGKASTATVRVRVELDPPTVDAGGDTTVLVGGDIRLPVRAHDGFGTIRTREVSVGNGVFLPIAEGDITFKAPNVPGTLPVVVRVTDDDGLHGLDTVFVTVLMSDNADLVGLSPSAGTLRPAFSPGTSAYAVQLPYQDSVLTVTATVRYPGAVLTVLDRPAASGVPSAPIAIPVGATSVPLRVVSPDGSHRTYTLNVTREPSSDATLRNLVVTGFALRPAFGSTVLQYADTVPFAATSATIRPIASNPEATILINGDTVPTTTARTYPLQFGENRFNVTVVAMDTAVRTTYTLQVVRRAKLYVYRKLGAAAPVLADSAELPPGTSRPFSTDANGYRFVRWVLQEGSAQFADSLANPTAITVGPGVARVQAHFELNRYTITAIQSGCGILRPGSVTVAHGGQQAYAIVPNPDCRIQSVRIDGMPNTAALSGSFTFTNVTSNRTIEATFAIIGKFGLSGNVAGGQGFIEPTWISADSGSTHTFRFRPAANYRFLSLQDGGRAVNPTAGDTAYTLANVTAPHQLRVRFLRRYTLTVQQSGCGTVTPGSVVVDSGSRRDFTFTPTPSSDCKVDSVFVNRVAVTPAPLNYTFANISRNDTLRVVFVRLFTVNTQWGTNGSNLIGGSLIPPTARVDSLDDFTIGISPASGYRLSALVAGSTPVSPLPAAGEPYILRRVTSNQTVTATFLRTFRVLGRVARGRGSINPAALVVDSATSIPFAFQPESGYRYDSLKVNGIAVNPASGNTQYILPPVTRESTTVAVSFWRQYPITTTASGCGVIAGAAGAQDSNSTLAYRVRPNAGCRIQSLTVDGASRAVTDTVLTFQTIREAHTVAAVFDSIPTPTYTLTATWGEPTAAAPGTNRRGGRLSPADTSVSQGGSATIRILPDANFRLRTLRVGGAEVQNPGTTYSFNNVGADQSINAVFVRTFRVTTLSNVPAAILNAADVTLDSGATMRVRWATPSGYRFTGLKVNNLPVEPGPSAQYDFPVQAASVCSVLFVQQFQVTGAVVGSDGGGTVTPASQTVDAGGRASVTVRASQGYRIEEIRDNGTVLPDGSNQPTERTVTLENIVGNRTITATFEQLPPSTFRVSASSTTPDLGRASPQVAQVVPGNNHVVSFESLDQPAFTQAVEVDGSPVAFNSGTSSYELSQVQADHRVEVTFVPRSEYSLLTLSTTAFQGSSGTPPQLCLGDSIWQGCTQQGGRIISRGMRIGDSAQVRAPASICPIGNSCSIADSMHFQHWEDRATGSQYDQAVMRVNITQADLHLVAVYASRGNLTDSLTVPPVLLNQGAGAAQEN